MRSRLSFWILLGLLLAGAWLFWPAGSRRAAHKPVAPPVRPCLVTTRSGSTAPLLLGVKNSPTNSVAKTNPFAWRLSNTKKSIGQLENDPHAILLANALLDTRNPLNFSIPKNLRAPGDPGAYIVQASGPIDAAFRARLAAAGAQIVSYIPNNAYLVTAPAGGVAALSGQPGVQTVIPYEPYYKISESLIGAAVEQKSLPDNTVLTLGLFANNAQPTVDQIKQLGATVVATDQSPFGPIVRVVPPANWTALADLPGVQIVEVAHRRALANDLARVTLGISADTVTLTNYLNLNGSNVLVEVNDSGIDQTHPDFSIGKNAASPSPAAIAPGSGRVLGDSPLSLVDTNGHGTHVAGIIAGNGWASYTVINTPQGSVTNADFRGKAPAAKLYSVAALDDSGTLDISDSYLQSAPAFTNALISNNSWVYADDNDYDLAAASYDAAVRDALPLVTGSQPVLFVFAAGNDGNGNDDGAGGTADSISSPATAKNVITVGALEQDRNITNTYTPLYPTNPVAPWQAGTSSSSEVASYSARGNVGIGTEGTYGRFKPDVVAPGTFVISTRSTMWDTNSYYSPTNYYDYSSPGQIVDTNGLDYFSLSDFGFAVKSNAVNVSIEILPNDLSPDPFPTTMPVYVSLNNFPDPTDATTYDFETAKDGVIIPPDGPANYLASIINNFGGFNFGVGDSTNTPVNFDLFVQMVTTNDFGNYYDVLRTNLNDPIGPWYRYESGTSMAAPAISGVLALIQDYFTNTLRATPSPALLKALLINGARPTGYYNLQVNNSINYEGWGLASVPNSIPPSPASFTTGPTNSTFFLDQSPTNALATGDSRTYQISLSPGAQAQPLRLTLAWTDPPGNPVAAIKLVNNLELIVTNMDNPANPVVYYGNDIGVNQLYNTAENPTNSAAMVDTINNVQNIFLPAGAGTNFTIVIYGASVNVNAVSAQTNNLLGTYAPNIVQDFAFVISSGDGLSTNGFTITASSAAANPTGDQRVTYVTNNTPSALVNQFVGASSPLLGTNTVGFGANTSYGVGALVTVGMTNQWHFYVVSNYGPSVDYTNAAFVTFLPDTLAIPRMGVFAGSDANSTRPEADIDLFVTTDPSLTNLNPVVISNCVNGAQVGLSVGGVFYGSALDRGGSEFVVDEHSTPGQVYYVGVQSEDQTASEYDFLSEFSNIPFSQADANGESVTFFPVNIPDGDATHPGYTNSIGLAIFPIDIQRVIVTNILEQQNAGDLVVSLSHSTVANGNDSVVLLNHNSPNYPGIFTNIYDDSGQGDIVNSQNSASPGSLNTYRGQEGDGVWLLHASDSAPGFIGTVSNILYIQRHQDLTEPGVSIAIPGKGYFYGYIDVPAGATNLTLAATNLSGTILDPNNYTLDIANPGQLFEKLGQQPAPPPTPPTNYDKMVTLNNGIPPGGTITVGPSDIPRIQPGRYYVTLYNASALPQTFYILATLGIGQVQAVDFNGGGSVPLLDDAVTYSYLTNYPTANATNETIATIAVGIRVDHPRISDLVFHLISPDGTRYLLMENRGGTSTNGAGGTIITTNLPPQTNYTYLVFTEDTNLTTTPIKFAAPPFAPNNTATNAGFTTGFEGMPADYVSGLSFSGWTVATNQVSVVSDPADAFAGSNFLALANGAISNTLPTVAGQTYTLSFAYRGPGIVGLWRGETNANDSINGNNGTPTGIAYAAGEVGQAFVYNGSTSKITIPASSSLNVGQDAGFSLDAWVNPVNYNSEPLLEWNNSGAIGSHFWHGADISPGDGGQTLYANLVDTTGANHQVEAIGVMGINVLQYVALTYNKTTGIVVLYHNGVEVTNKNLGVFTPQTTYNFNLGFRPSAGPYYTGALDEPSVYNRVLSASEINAIFKKGHTGKYDTAATFSQNMAEATVNLQGNSPVAISGNNLNWQTYTTTFTATQNGTPLTISGVEPGMLLDSVSLTSLPVYSNIYYLPEESLDPLIGTSAYGVWTLEIQDDRVGATNNAVLDAWQLQAVFADTNPVPVTLTNSIPLTNTVPANGIVWYQVNVPLNADIATNTLIFATLPVNLLVNPTAPSTNGATALLTGSTGGSANLTATTAPPLIPGFTYYLGVQNNNNVAVNFAVEVTFHLLGIPYAYTEPAQLVTGTSAQLNGMASPNGYAANAWFQWGTNTLYGNQTPPVAVGASYGVVYTTNAIINLVTNVPYHFRLVVSNAQGVAYGFDQILDEANVVAWGPDYAGQLNVPTNLNNVVAIAGAYDHSLALRTNGLVVAWGDNTFGQATVPLNLSNVVAVAGGQYYSLALQSSGTVVSWGANLLTQTNVPAGLSNVVTIAGGTYSSLALQNNGAVVAWGANFFGLTNVPAGASNIVAVAGGGYHSVALKNDGTVIVWGDNSAGQTNVPSNLNNVAAIAAGGYHSLALKYDGTVVAWGDNSVGQTNVPVGLSNVVAIAAGGFHSLALKADGTVVAWGDNTAGQTSVPVGLTSSVAVTAGYLHSLALTPQSLINSTNVIVLTLVPGVPQTNNIFGGGITYYKVTVPTNADFATNILLFANNGPLNIWFSTNTPPVLNSADATQLSTGSVTNGTWVISSNTPAVLVPGSTYYLGVQNPNSFTVSYAVEVDFHLITASVTLPIDFYSIIHTNINGTNGYLLTWFAPSNDLFQVQWADGIPPVWNTFSNIISFNTNVFTGPLLTQFNFFDDGTQTGGFPNPTRFYNLVLLGSFANLTNGVPQTNSVAAGGTAYFAVNVPANVDIGTNNLLFASAPVSLLFNQAVLPTGANSGGFTLLTNSIGGSTNLSATSAPPLVSGATYYLGVKNTNAFAVNFSLLVNFHSATSPATNTVYPISSVTYSNGDFLLTWLAPTNDLFTVQVATNLALPLGWQTIATNIAYTGPVTATNGWFSYLDTNSTGTLRFYQLLLQGVPASVPPITGFAYTTNGFTLTWSAPASEQFQVKWTTNFVPPVTWTPFPGIITSTNGIFSFTDTNAPLLLKFYELMLLP